LTQIKKPLLLRYAMLALLCEAASDHDVNDSPDGIFARLDRDGLDIEYTRAGLPVGGEGL